MILFVILLMLTTSTCQTVKEYVTYRYVLPPFPKREIIVLPDEPAIKDYAEIINYYDSLVEQWEEWGKNVEKILDTK